MFIVSIYVCDDGEEARGSYILYGVEARMSYILYVVSEPKL
jgi:hypothetical protein